MADSVAFAHPAGRASRAVPPRRRRAPGFSLLEVLVAVVVLSFGVLGVVGLQAASLQANKEARYQSTATRLARELGDMMRGNKDIANNTTSATNPYLLTSVAAPTLPAAPEDCSTIVCTTNTTLAQFQIREWLSRVQVELPGSIVTTCFDSAPYDASGNPQWACTGGAGSVMVVKIGWARSTTNRSAAASAAIDQATVPGVILPIIPG